MLSIEAFGAFDVAGFLLTAPAWLKRPMFYFPEVHISFLQPKARIPYVR